MSELLYRDEVYAIVGAAMEVHSVLGPGFAEAIYQEALEIELEARSIPFARQTPIQVRYKDRVLEKMYIADVVCYQSIIVELKVVPRTGNIEEGQVLNYLKATGYRVGLLINFAVVGKLDWQRFVL
jgi:GxxExxY protein